MHKNFLIIGANFRNKGAQSMLFVTVNELKNRVPDCSIYFASSEAFDNSTFAFDAMHYSDFSKLIALNPNSIHIKYKKYRRWIKDVIKLMIGRRTNLFTYNDTARNIAKMNLVIDISGFSIGSKWDAGHQESYLNNIRLAKKYNIPIVLMPQSFGDFNYSKEQEYLLPQIEKLFRYPKVIFAREKEGYQALTERFHLNNVRLSTDLVLQNIGVDLTNIYRKIPKMDLPEVEKDAVAVIPNQQCFNHGDGEKNLKTYETLIGHLISKGKKIYVFRHSKEDLPICRQIAGLFLGKDVTLLKNDFSCFEYDEFIRNFDFIICSRYHGCVHAYRNAVPCILLGWAVKYQELAENVGQGQYAFDFTDKDFNVDRVIGTIDWLDGHKDEESVVIKNHVSELQKHNCFDQMEEWLL